MRRLAVVLEGYGPMLRIHVNEPADALGVAEIEIRTLEGQQCRSRMQQKNLKAVTSRNARPILRFPSGLLDVDRHSA